jgi:predicted TIM-barrel fold metal-dependent hydrolase
VWLYVLHTPLPIVLPFEFARRVTHGEKTHHGGARPAPRAERKLHQGTTKDHLGVPITIAQPAWPTVIAGSEADVPSRKGLDRASRSLYAAGALRHSASLWEVIVEQYV